MTGVKQIGLAVVVAAANGRQSWEANVSLKSKTICLHLILAAWVTLCAPVNAATIAYTLNNVTYGNSGIDGTLAGGFNYDTVTGLYTDIQITTTGTLGVETFDQLGGPSSFGPDYLTVSASPSLDVLTLTFLPDLATTPLGTLITVVTDPPTPSLIFIGDSSLNQVAVDLFTDGYIVGTSAAPLPAALPLFATGLGAMGLLARRRKRKSVADAAA
jgi:hypothetical protein